MAAIKDVSASISVLLLLLACTEATNVFDVTSFGAKDGGISDIRQAFRDAWKGACESPNASKVVVPKGTFLLGQVTLEGPCKAPIQVQVVGILKAPEDPNSFPDGDGWVTFNHVDQFTLFGGGVFDGQGSLAWTKNECSKNSRCHKLPTNLRFNFVTNAIIRGVTSKDSKLFHVNVLGGKNVTFYHFTISAPGNSINTDGIHIGRSIGVNITKSRIQTGDDCISMGDGSQQIHIEKVTCGPGHGISVGSLGKYPNEEAVSGIVVKNCTISNTDNGVRVKTWPASHDGTASDMYFEDILMKNVRNPIIVDQEYCPYNQCKFGIPSRIKISNVSFKNIRGTSASQLAVKIVCSKAFPCENVEVGDINLTYNGTEGPAFSQCANVHHKLTGHQNIPICSSQ